MHALALPQKLVGEKVTEVKIFVFWCSIIFNFNIFFVSTLFKKLLPKNRKLNPPFPCPLKRESKYAWILENFENIEMHTLKYLYRVFRLDGTSLIPQVQQHKLNTCSIVCLSKTLRELCYKYLNLPFSKNLHQFSKHCNSRTKNYRDVWFTPKCVKYNAVFLVNKIRGMAV